jgi:hypothetical protein
VRQREEVQEVLPAQVKLVIAAEPGAGETRRIDLKAAATVTWDVKKYFLT